MDDDRFLVAADKVVSFLGGISPSVYSSSKLPSEFDEGITEFCTLARQATPIQREVLCSSLDEQQYYLLLIFANRMAMLGVRQNEPGTLLVGLIALALVEVQQIDWREIVMTLSLIHNSIIRLDEDPQGLFCIAAQYASSDSVRDLILEYLARSPENKSIEKMGFREIDGPSGIIYQLGNQPIPDGLL